MSIDVNDLERRLTLAHRAKARADGAREAAEASAATIRAEMKRDFGVDTVEDAEKLLAQWQTRLDELTKHITDKLDEMGL